MSAHRSPAKLGWIAGLLVLSASSPVRAAERVLVRSYNMAHVAPPTLAHAKTMAAAILRDALIDVEWRECSSGGCGDPPGPAELVVRTVVAPFGATAGALGCALIDVGGQSGTLATIYADRVAEVAERTHVDPGTLLGRAIAHEVGHMLLGTPDHAPRGLMRARWLDRELRRDRAGDWTWSVADVLQMQRHLSTRRGEPVAPFDLIAVAVLNVGPLRPSSPTCHEGRCVSK